jgi:hypothetical protein
MISCSYSDGACATCGRVMRGPQVLRECHGKFEASPPVEQMTTHGPGTELSKLLKRLGIEPTPTCQCREKAQEMDAWGCDEASKPERIDEVVAVMRAEAEARGLPFIDVAGRLLVKRAISNARRNA